MSDRYTVLQLATLAALNPNTAKARLRRAGIKPVEYIGPTGMYGPEALEHLKEPPEVPLVKDFDKRSTTFYLNRMLIESVQAEARDRGISASCLMEMILEDRYKTQA